jgi:glutamate/tyrosine decarboxylase-like PLP-dependent enzyme
MTLKRRDPRTLAAVTLLSAVAMALAGCNGDDQVTVSLNNGGSGATITGSRAAKELTLAEGQKLLGEIAKDPKRLDKLTPEEKRYLQRALAAKAVRKQEKDEGR